MIKIMQYLKFFLISVPVACMLYMLATVFFEVKTYLNRYKDAN